MRGVSRGHSQLPADGLRVTSWTAGIVGGPVHDAPTSLEEWTQGIDVEVDTVFELNDSGANRTLGLAPEAQLGVQTLWHSPGTKLRGASAVVSLVAGEVSTSLRVPGHRIRKHLRLEHVVVVTAPGRASNEFAPVRTGSIVWSSDPETVRLEGVAPRLPVLPRKFSNTVGFEGRHAMWWLNLLSSDLDSDAAAAIWLWVNSENERVAAMLEEPEAEPSRILVSLMGADVARQLILIALNDEDFDPTFSFVKGSLGMVLRNLVNLVGMDIRELRIMLRDAPTELDARIQARTAGVLS